MGSPDHFYIINQNMQLLIFDQINETESESIPMEVLETSLYKLEIIQVVQLNLKKWKTFQGLLLLHTARAFLYTMLEKNSLKIVVIN